MTEQRQATAEVATTAVETYDFGTVGFSFRDRRAAVQACEELQVAFNRYSRVLIEEIPTRCLFSMQRGKRPYG